MRARRHKQEADIPNAVKGRRLNAQVQEEQKGDLEVGFFVELKNRHIIQQPPEAAGLAP